MKIWLAFVLGFFSFAAGDPDPNPNPDADATDPNADIDLGDDPASDADPGADPAGDPEPDPKAQLAEEQKARQAAEARAQDFERQMGEMRSRGAPTQTEDQKIFAAEEERLKNKDTTDLERWQIDANRKLRAGNGAASAALFEARDIADRTAFRQLEVTKPALFKRYEKRVEEELLKARRAGGNARREDIMRFLIGNDAMDGKLAPKKKADANPNPAANLNRGKLPGAKSDVRGKNPMSEHEKRRARLENVQI